MGLVGDGEAVSVGEAAIIRLLLWDGPVAGGGQASSYREHSGTKGTNVLTLPLLASKPPSSGLVARIKKGTAGKAEMGFSGPEATFAKQ